MVPGNLFYMAGNFGKEIIKNQLKTELFSQHQSKSIWFFFCKEMTTNSLNITKSHKP